MILIALEDNDERIREMKRCIPKAYQFIYSKTEVGVIKIIKDNISKGMVISLDHDLEKEKKDDPDPGDGRGVVRWLAENRVPATVIIHTSNNIMGDSMYYNLLDAGYIVERVSPYEGVVWIGKTWAKVLEKWSNQSVNSSP